jgi:ligand-binding sensor domain-containing protein
MNRYVVLFFFLLHIAAIVAQEPKFMQHEIGIDYKDVAINEVLQDHQGMIWLGTGKGLVRYDGTEWYTIILDTTISAIEVKCLFEDNRQNLWVGTTKGNIYYLDKARNVHIFDIEEGHPSKPIRSILQDKQGQIWFATYGEGAYIYTGTRLFNFDKNDGLAGNDIYSMTSDPEGEVWIGTDDGISICTFINEQKHYRNLGLADDLPDQIITALKADKQGNVWIGTSEAGVVLFDAGLHKITRPFEPGGMDEITTFEMFDGTELWIGTKTSGVWRYSVDFKFARQLVSSSSLKQFEVTDILSDVEGNIWLAMREGMLLSAFRPFESLITAVGEIQTLYCDHNDRLWIGAIKGLYYVEANATKTSATIRVAPSYDFNITDIVEDDFHHLWIATLDKGLFIYSPASGEVKEISSRISRLGSSIMSMDRTKDEIWIASQQGAETGFNEDPFTGVFSYPANNDITIEKNLQFQFLTEPWKSHLEFVWQIFVDSKDRIWLATDGNGVYSIDKGKATQYKGNESLDLRGVYSVCEDHTGHIWLNTQGLGLIELNEDKYISKLGLAEGLKSIDISSMAKTHLGDILISHRNGIDLMDPRRQHFMYYTTEIGAEEFEPTLNAVTTDSKGNVYIGGKNLILKYCAANQPFTVDPQTVLTRVTVNQEPIDYTSKHVFTYDQNYFSFEYIGLWYVNPHSVTYEYMLSPRDLKSNESKDNQIAYSDLPPGDYTFTVKASENESFFNEPTASYSFTIKKPFWWTAWFIIFMAVFSVLFFYWLIKSRDKRIERRAALKRDMIESQLQALKAQINPHFLFNSFNTLITIIDENTLKPQVAIEYVEKLSDFFRSILLYREQETISLEEEWQLVQNFGYLLEKRYGSTLRLHLDSPPRDAYILPLTLQMLVENAVKHNVISADRPLDVFITVDPDQYITVRNNLQPKTKPESSTRFGLQSIIKRYQLLSERKVLIEKDQETFKVRIPILKKTTE